MILITEKQRAREPTQMNTSIPPKHFYNLIHMYGRNINTYRWMNSGDGRVEKVK